MFPESRPDNNLDQNPVTTNNIGAPAGTGVSAKEYGDGLNHLTVLDLAALRIAVADSGGANGGFGGQKIYDFPEGHIIVLGAVTKIDSIARVSTGIAATATVKHSLGTALEATNDTLDSAQAEVLPSSSSVLVAGVLTGGAGGVSTATLIKDGTVTAVDLYLNIGVADAGISASDNVDITGRVYVSWRWLGDKTL